MENILIAFSPDGKQIAAGLQSSLKSAGYKSTLGCMPRELEKSQPKFAVAVITGDSNLDADFIVLMSALERKLVNVVPYVAAELGKSVLADFFLDEHVWIDAANQKPKDALDDLLDCIKNNFGVLSGKAEKKCAATRPKSPAQQPGSKSKAAAQANAEQLRGKMQLFRNLFMVSLAVIAVMLFLLVSGGVRQENREAANQLANQSNASKNSNITIQLNQDLRKSESALVGRWVMSDYTDNQFRATREDSIQVQSMVDQIINKAQLVFSPNKTFQRIGFSTEVESGSWEYDPQSKYLKLQPTGVNQYDVVQVQDVSDNTLVIVVQENVQQATVLTKMTFKKIANQ